MRCMGDFQWANIMSLREKSAPLLPIVSQFVLVRSLIFVMPLLASSCKTHNIKINLQKNFVFKNFKNKACNSFHYFLFVQVLHKPLLERLG